jgi:uncharacterized protein (TIGR00299 family) protein
LVERSYSVPRAEHDALFLDMLGGIAGDMFIAAVTDLYPDLEPFCTRVFDAIPSKPNDLAIRFFDHSDAGRFGRRFNVSRGERADHGHVHHEHGHDPDEHRHGARTPQHDHHEHRHVGFADAVRIVAATDVASAVRHRAQALFELLAKAEGEIHGVPYEKVQFHEIGGWDSIVDIILSAAVIEEIDAAAWHCGPIPVGRGSVWTEHGRLPVPAPATLKLLHGFAVYQDQFFGERVTPTGAAILQHLRPRQLAGLPLGELSSYGCGYGSKEIEGLSNALRVYALRPATAHTLESVAVVELDVDDETPEDLAIGLEALRQCAGVLDVVQVPVYGKRGRVAIQVRALVESSALSRVVDTCLSATSSLGVRWHEAKRAVLARESRRVQLGDGEGSMKVVRRPDGRLSGKVESADLQSFRDSYARREELRRVAARQLEDDVRRPENDDDPA